jgi:hypothetical protein
LHSTSLQVSGVWTQQKRAYDAARNICGMI